MKIKKAEFHSSIANVSSVPRMQLPTVAFAGRSNVGKSSLINVLLNRKNIAKTSNTPGKTRFINYYVINDNLYFADLPGYGYARVSKNMRESWKGLIEPFLSQNDRLTLVCLLVDIRHGLKDTDAQLLEFLQHHDRNIQIILTKFDKISKNQAEKQRRDIIKKVHAAGKPIFFSALKKTGVSDVWAAILKKGNVTL